MRKLPLQQARPGRHRGGIPRVLDAGQCNDSYSLVAVALKLAEVFGVESVNDLPISYDIAGTSRRRCWSSWRCCTSTSSRSALGRLPHPQRHQPVGGNVRAKADLDSGDGFGTDRGQEVIHSA
ncbi:MAG: hypothetical protein R2856_22680 [Caldilineaceae bacterium]